MPSGEGFGIITSDGKVVAAMYQLDRTNQDTFEELLKEQQDGMGAAKPELENGRSLHFWFWRDAKASQTLMVCELATSAGLNMTIAMGDDGVLQKLNISPESARAEIAQLDRVPSQNPAPLPKN
jgi:hypothetical protein